MSTVEFGCPGCRRAIEAAPGEMAVCENCGEEAKLEPVAEDLGGCLACECPELYRHRDFNQKLGLVIIASGVLLWLVLGSFLPMVAAAAIDVVLYFTLPDVAICYRCKAHHRGFSNIKALPTFDLERHEHYRFVEAREQGRVPPRGEA